MDQFSNKEVLETKEHCNNENPQKALERSLPSIRDVGLKVFRSLTDLMVLPVPDDIPVKTLDELEKTLKTGDLLLFSGNYVISRLIRVYAKIPFSHSAMLVRDKDGLLYVWECYETGPRKVRFDQTYLDNYDGPIVVRDVVWTKNVDEAAALKFVEEILAKKFPWVYLEDIIRGWFNFGPTGKGYFCSSLVAETLQVMNLLSKDVLINTVYPKHFLGNWLEKQGLAFKSYYRLKKSKLMQSHLPTTNTRSMSSCLCQLGKNRAMIKLDTNLAAPSVQLL